MGKIICESCSHNMNNIHCTWQVNVYPYATRCNHYKGAGMNALNVIALPVKETPAVVVEPPEKPPVELTVFSSTEPDKSIYYSKLP
jgi:hypothetical protein